MKFNVVLIPDKEDGGFVVEVPGLPGCVTQGDTIEESLKNAKEAIKLHLEGIAEEDGKLVESDPSYVMEVEVQ